MFSLKCFRKQNTLSFQFAHLSVYTYVFPLFIKLTRVDLYNFFVYGSIHKFYFDLGPKRYLGRRNPIIGRMGLGGGFKLNVKGITFPVNKRIRVTRTLCKLCIVYHNTSK